MCGFFGIVGQFEPDRAKKALKQLTHRGPDRCGIYEEEGIFVGHHRLTILDPDAHQPMIESEWVLAFNGEIYNYQAFDPRSDTRAILKAYLRYGEEFVHRIDGMFALALWDGAKLLLVRDLFGKKPLYYAPTSDGLIFASEIKAIVEYLQKAPFRSEALGGYLSFGAVPDRSTFYEGIYKLPARTILVYDGTLQLRRYGTILEKDPGDLHEAVVKSIKSRLQGKYPVAALLSGGIDSSLVSAIAKGEQGDLVTYSIGYPDDRYSELEWAKEVALHIDSDHREVRFGRDEFFHTLDTVLDHFDEPVGDSATLPLWYLLHRIGDDGFRVVLGGEGGDELFLGYRLYFEMADILKAKELRYRNWLKNYFLAHYSPNREWEWYKRIWCDEVLFRSSCEVFTDRQKDLLMQRSVPDGESLTFLEDVLSEWRESGWEDHWAFFTLVDLKVRQEALYLHRLDMASMAHSIEARTPLLDSSILKIALADPKRSQSPKKLLKEVARRYLPPSVIDRKKKGFSYPHIRWLFESDYPKRMLEINDEVGFFRRDRLQFLIESARRNRFSRHFWIVLAFLLWFERRFL